MDKIKKIVIMIPNTKWFDRRYFHLTPYTPCLLASIMKDHAEVEIIDTNIYDLDFEQTKDEIRKHSPDMVGITCLSMEYANSAYKLAELAKEVNKEIVTVIGGIFATLLPKQAMKNESMDYAILGEGEYRFPEFVKRLNKNESFENFDGIAYRQDNQIIVSAMRSYVENLDEVPFPDFTKIDHHKYFNTATKGSLSILPKQFPYIDTITARGCPYRCIFCSSKAINGPKIRYRSAESVLNEIDWLVKEFGVRHITFNDDNLFLNKTRIKKILNGLIERNYDLTWKSTNAAVYALNDEVLELIKASGGYQLFLAIESGNEHVLNKIIKKPLNLKKVNSVVKKCKELGIQTSGIYIIGLPGETWDQIRETIAYAEELDTDCLMINIATPLPCTEMYDIAKKKGYLGKDVNFDTIATFGFGKATMTTEEFTPFELQVLRAFEWDRIVFKTEAKKKTMCELLGINSEELEALRKESRRKLGMPKIFDKPIEVKEME